MPVRTLPAVHELVDGDSNLLRQLREVQVEDVLGRDPVQLDPEEIGGYVRGRVGARDRRGRLDRLRALPPARAHEPDRLVLLDHAEKNLFQIERELRERGVTSIVPVIGDVQRRGAASTAFLEHQRPRSCSTPRPTSTCR